MFGTNNQGVSKKEDCENLPDALKDGCNWRFDWFKDAAFPRYTARLLTFYTTLMSHSAHFKRVVCPAELSQRSGCARNDDKVLSGEVSAANSLSSASSTASIIAALMLGVLSI